MAPCCLLRFLVLCYFPLLLLAQSGIKYYGNCPLYYHCKEKFGDIDFPLSNTTSSECGLRIKGCDDDPYTNVQVQLGNQKWYDFSPSEEDKYSITVQDEDLQKLLPSNSCSAFDYHIPSFPLSTIMPFQIANMMITLYKCKRALNVNSPVNWLNYTRCHDYDIYYPRPYDIYYPPPYDINYPPPQHDYSFHSCSKIQLPIGPRYLPNVNDLFPYLSSELHIKVNLSEKCIQCYEKEDTCLDDGKFSCGKAAGKPRIWKVILVSAAVGLGVLFILICCYCFQPAGFWKNKSKAHQDFEAFLKSHGPLALRRYSYSEIKQITNSFKEKLGQGGYGGVFKGKLHDDCLVAVKVLSESKGNGEEFINEVASISRTSHVNIVALLGFCFEGSKRALVYEFMPNGSLEKFIYETNPSMGNQQLNSEILYQIAIGVARGLEYLHRGCNTRILHFDIKPHNILLDENFCPKISDFGLAKICPRKESIVSMLGARGTIGYIAPEIFSRNFGGVSHKSDVYSYGMMVLEMVGGRKNINVEVDHTSEIYFPHWIYKRLELNEDFALRNITNDNDKNMTRKMVIVSLWCIQTNPADRPTIGRVVEMLEGRVETLQIPQKPFLSSPPRSPPTSSTY